MTENERPQDNTVSTAFPVEMTKDDYTAYYMMLSSMAGPLRFQKSVSLFFVAYGVLNVALFVSAMLSNGVWDWAYFALILAVVLLGLGMLLAIPRRIKKTALQMYRQGDFDGYYGLLHITETMISKETASELTSVPFRAPSMYIEDSGFMAFFSPAGQKTIVLPAHCLTEADAALLRERVFSSDMKKQIKRRMTAGAAAHIPPREMASNAVQMQLDVEYTEQELLKIATDGGLRRFMQQLPLFAVMAALFGLMLTMLYENALIGGVGCLAMILLMLFASVFGGRSKVKRLLVQQPQAFRTRVTLTEQGIETTAGGAAPTRASWRSLEHAVEKTDCVEFTSAAFFLRIPKRCIPDPEALRQLVNERRKR